MGQTPGTLLFTPSPYGFGLGARTPIFETNPYPYEFAGNVHGE